ncbi:hypothetical protein LTR10_000292 [Elasticomyces elasticus]|nr:hypothetical protein LTR10_000292 [Elasticomyces elasticus]KAK4980452.1 hypothetical protein LTR42_000759 [Elasticomyces elasticus]
MTREALGPLSVGETYDLTAELVRAANCGFHHGPVLAEFKLAGYEHVTITLQFKLITEGVALVRGEEELESIFSEIGIIQLHGGIGERSTNALKGSKDKLPPAKDETSLGGVPSLGLLGDTSHACLSSLAQKPLRGMTQ